MKPENQKLIEKALTKAKVPFSPRGIYRKSMKISYRTFLRGIIYLMKERYIFGYKVSHGRGKGINWIITSKNELLEEKEKT